MAGIRNFIINMSFLYLFVHCSSMILDSYTSKNKIGIIKNIVYLGITGVIASKVGWVKGVLSGIIFYFYFGCCLVGIVSSWYSKNKKNVNKYLLKVVVCVVMWYLLVR